MVSLIIPLYNEQDTIALLQARLSAFLMEFRHPIEVIFVDDGSTDHTLERLNEICEEGYKIISYPHNRGKGHALKRGVEQARGEYIFYTDADLTYGLQVINKAMQVFRTYHCDIVVGSRHLANFGYEDRSWVHKLASFTFAHAFAILIRSYLHIGQSDSQCGFKGFRAEVARHLFAQCQVEGFGIDFEVLYLAAREKLDVREMAAQTIHVGQPSSSPVRDTLHIMGEMKNVKRLHK
ncbi:MAG: glycosyltransferase [Eubacteriales bacterium]